MDTVTLFKILDKTVYISQSANIFGERYESNYLPPAMGKYLVRLSSSTEVWKPVLEKENSEFKPVNFT